MLEIIDEVLWQQNHQFIYFLRILFWLF